MMNPSYRMLLLDHEGNTASKTRKAENPEDHRLVMSAAVRAASCQPIVEHEQTD